MLRPTDIENLKGNNSRYAVVVGVAKRARDIAIEADARGDILTEKTVSLAINDLNKGEYRIIVPEDKKENETEKAEDKTE